MADLHSPEDQATLYVLGELTAAERREFEARLAQSAELRALVRELEEGALALSTGLPQHRPPPQVWSGIEKAVIRENRRGAAIWWKIFWRNGWAAAALCLVGWLVYAMVLNHRSESKTTASNSEPPPEIVATHSSPTVQHPVVVPSTPTNSDSQSPDLRTVEMNDLRLKLADIERETSQLSLLLDQARARLGETNRIKFYHLTTDSNASGNASNPQLSPAMQRAMLVTIGRELGWLPMASKSRVGNGHTTSTIDGIDFVDFRSPNGNGGNQPASQPSGQPANQAPSQPVSQPPGQLVNQNPGQQPVETQTADVAEPSIPAFASGDRLVVGLDSSVAPANSSVTFAIAGTSWAAASWSFTMGENPTMVTVPFSANSFGGGGLTLIVNSVTPTGISNTMQFFAPTSP